MSSGNLFTALINSKEYTIQPDKTEKGKGSMNGIAYEMDMIKSGENKYHVIHNNRSYSIELIKTGETGKELSLLVNGNKYQVQLKDQFDHLLKSLGMENLGAAKINELKAPMPGLVLDIRVEVGQEVQKGEALLVLEAMKMENVLKCPADVKIKKISVNKGQAVEKNQVLILFE